MRVLLRSRKLSEPAIIADIGSIVVEDEHGNAIFVARQHDDDVIMSLSVDDERFEELLPMITGGSFSCSVRRE